MLGRDLKERDRQSLRDALEALKQARAYAAREGDRYAREAVRLATLAKKSQSLLNPAITLEHIALNVCRKYGISYDDLKSPHRARSLVAARHEFFYLARTLTSRSYGEIGRWCGDRDHTTVMHGERRHKQRVDGRLREAGEKVNTRLSQELNCVNDERHKAGKNVANGLLYDCQREGDPAAGSFGHSSTETCAQHVLKQRSSGTGKNVGVA